MTAHRLRRGSVDTRIHVQLPTEWAKHVRRAAKAAHMSRSSWCAKKLLEGAVAELGPLPVEPAPKAKPMPVAPLRPANMLRDAKGRLCAAAPTPPAIDYEALDIAEAKRRSDYALWTVVNIKDAEHRHGYDGPYYVTKGGKVAYDRAHHIR